MRQVLQNLRTGEIEVPEIPAPTARPHHLLIRTRASLISAGTERASVASGKESLLSKAMRNPDKVVEVLKRVGREGVGAAAGQVQTALERLAPLGYSNVGEVIGVGDGVAGFEVGMRVASNGAHAEIVSVPASLCQPVPAAVDDEAASFTVLGAIALQSVRLAAPTVGETFVVSGLGMVGLLAVQILRASGAQVIGLDFAPARLALARQFGARTIDLNDEAAPARACVALNKGRGIDGVIVAAATESDAPVAQAAEMCRQRGRIVLVGVAGLHLSRDLFYAKELSFQVSCSYGPGRYDPAYEAGGQDYPLGFVRWTAGRNFEAVLDMLADGRMRVAPLVSDRIDLAEAGAAYARISGGGDALGLLFRYPDTAAAAPVRRVAIGRMLAARTGAGPRIGLIGAGAYATGTLLPALQAAGVTFGTVVGRDGVNATRVARRFGFATAATEMTAVLDDPAIDVVVIATPHRGHAAEVVAALGAGKHVFVEKPLAIDRDGLTAVEAALAAASDRHLMVGFNRRFAPHTIRLKELLAAEPAPPALTMTVNAGGAIAGHWTADAEVGGGRLIGEGCHFIDLLTFLAGTAPVWIGGQHLAGDGDCFVLSMRFANGAVATLNYLTNGHGAVPKERLEAFCGGKVARLDNFESLTLHGWPAAKSVRTRTVDKGNHACMAAFVAAVREGGPAPVPITDLLASSTATLDAVAAVRNGVPWSATSH